MPKSDEIPACPIAPINDRVVVLDDEKVKQVGLIHMPDQAAPAPQSGTVVAVGPGKFVEGVAHQETRQVSQSVSLSTTMPVRYPMSLSVGDKVWFGRFAGSVITIGGVDYRVLREDEVLGVQS